MKKAITLLIVFAVFMSVCTTSFASTGNWYLDDYGWWYQNEDGSYPYSTWQLIDGSWYHFNDYGYMQTGWLNDNGNWYYLSASGEVAIGWVYDGVDWYYMSGSGIMQTGWLYDNGAWYYLNPSGAMATSYVTIDGITYYFNSNGMWIGGSSDGGSQETNIPYGMVIDENEWNAWESSYSVKLWPFMSAWTEMGFTIDLPSGQEKYHKVGTFKFKNGNTYTALKNTDAYYGVENQIILYSGLSTASLDTFNSADYREACIRLLLSYNTSLTYGRAEEIVDYCLKYVEHCIVDNMRIRVLRQSDYYAFHIEF